jgi:hypothetical protein
LQLQQARYMPPFGTKSVRSSDRHGAKPVDLLAARAQQAVEDDARLKIGNLLHRARRRLSIIDVGAIEHNQLWRDHMLAVALRHHPRSQYAATRLLVVHHREDLTCVRVCAGYRSLLCDGDDTLSSISLDRLVDRWSGSVEEPARTD